MIDSPAGCGAASSLVLFLAVGIHLAAAWQQTVMLLA
jgi:hypothetical protein